MKLIFISVQVLMVLFSPKEQLEAALVIFHPRDLDPWLALKLLQVRTQSRANFTLKGRDDTEIFKSAFSP